LVSGTGDITFSQADNNAGTGFGAVTIHSADNIYQSGAWRVTGPTTLTAANDITLNSANLLGGVVNLDGHDISMSNVSDTQFGNVAASGNFFASLFGVVTQVSNTAMTIAGPADINGESNDVTLTNSNNLFSGAVRLTGNNVHLTQQAGNDLTLANVNGYGDISVSNVGGTLTFTSTTPTVVLRGAVSNAKVMLIADHFDNQNTGNASPIDLGIGTGNVWQFYLSNLDGNTFGSGSNILSSGNQAVWNTVYPISIPLPGNRYIFATTQTLNLMPISNALSLTATSGAGTTLPTPVNGTNYSLTGVVNAGNYGNVFTQDTAANLFDTLSFSSAGSSTTAAVGSYDVILNAPTTTATGYAVITHNPYGTLAITTNSNNGGGSGGGTTDPGNGGGTGGSSDPGTPTQVPEALASVASLFNVDAANATKSIAASLPHERPKTRKDIESMSDGVNPNLHQ